MSKSPLERLQTFGDIQDFLDEHRDVKLTFGLEYSSIVDWVAEFVPGRNHSLARQYNGPWREQRTSLEEAVNAAAQKFLEMKHEFRSRDAIRES